MTFRSAPEFSSVVTFVQFLCDEDRSSFTSDELGYLNYRLQTPVSVIRAELESYGLTLAHRPPERRVPGFTTSSSDRWFGPGSCPTFGGAVYDQVIVPNIG